MTGQKVTPTGVLVAPYNLPEDEWHALRRTGIGGSDVAALIGLDRYSSPYELYLEKRGEKLPPTSEWLARAAYWGHKHERDMAERFCELTGFRTRRVGLLRHEVDEWRLANLDFRVLGCPDGPCFLELKNRSYWKAREWGATGADEGVPDKEALQTVHYLAVTGYRHCHVGALINGNDDRWYRIDWDQQLIDDVLEMERQFWFDHVLAGVAPEVDSSAAVTELLAVLWTSQADAELVVPVAPALQLLTERRSLKEQIALLNEQLDGVENQLKEPLGDKEIAVALSGDAPLYTWKQNGQFSEKRFRADNPELAAKYETTVPALDVAAIKTNHPDEYRAARARVLRTPGRS